MFTFFKNNRFKKIIINYYFKKEKLPTHVYKKKKINKTWMEYIKHFNNNMNIYIYNII